MNEPHCRHFPNYPVMPGVLIIEALAQVGAFALLMKDEHRAESFVFLPVYDCVPLCVTRLPLYELRRPISFASPAIWSAICQLRASSWI
ncbi:MAG: hypothetical protein IMX04_08100 [Candidatus Carbobacillus altaicus]|nr:hypothetical protein [Candidatus Carbobacillus altaicus]